MFKKKIMTSVVLASLMLPLQVGATGLEEKKGLEEKFELKLEDNRNLDYFKNSIAVLKDFRLDKNVTIIIGEDEVQMKTKEETISELLNSIGLETEETVVIPSLDSMIKDGDEILVLNQTRKFVYEIEEEDYITNEIFTIDLNLGEKKVQQKGVPQLTKKTLLEESKNGILMKRTEINKEVVQEKIDKEILIGAREVVKEKIPFEIISKENPKIEEGVSKTLQEGSDGELTKIYYNDGKERNLIEESEKKSSPKIIEIGTKKKVSLAKDSKKDYTLKEFMFHGVVRSDNKKFTYYSQSVLPGGGLKIPGRHISKDGYISDKDGYIVVASSSSIKKGTVINTPFGAKGKVYDICASCDPSWFDVYVK